MPVQTRSMIKREMQKQQETQAQEPQEPTQQQAPTQQQEPTQQQAQTQQQTQAPTQQQAPTQTQQQTQEERLTKEYNKMKYIEEFNITELNMTQQYMQSVLSENTVILRKAIIKCITNLALFIHIINEPSLYDLRIDIIITIFKYTEGLFILNSIVSGEFDEKYKKLLITSFDKIKRHKNSNSDMYTPVQQKKLNDALDNFMFNVVKYI